MDGGLCKTAPELEIKQRWDYFPRIKYEPSFTVRSGEVGMLWPMMAVGYRIVSLDAAALAGRLVRAQSRGLHNYKSHFEVN